MLYQLSYIGLPLRPAYRSSFPSWLAPACAHVRSANIARTASVTRRIRWSLRVIHAKIPKATNAVSATAKRFKRSLATNTRDFGCGLPLRSRPQIASTWCTGKDSNLRTSEEGQIYSLLALTTHPPVQNCRTVRPLLPTSTPTSGFIRRYSRQRTEIVRTDLQKVRILANVKNRNVRAKMLSHANTTLGKFPYGVPLENLLSRRAAYPASGTNAGAGEGI